MKIIRNILWILFGGLILCCLYWIYGLIMCCTIIGIPFGVQLLKFGAFAFLPFEQQMTNSNGETGCLATLMNIFWILSGWWKIALIHLLFGILFCCTIIGIPFGKQHFKIAAASILPFGKEIH